MITIQKRQDIQEVKNQVFHAYLNEYFSYLQQELGEDEDFSLEEHGPIIILEKTDDLENLKETGVENLYLSVPEWVEMIQLKNLTICQIAILCNNEYMELFYITYPVEGRLQQWLEQWM